MKLIKLLFFGCLLFLSTMVVAQPVVYTIDNTLATQDGNYATFYEACDYLMTQGSTTDSIIFNVTAGQVFLNDSIYLQEFNKTGGKTVIFQKSGDGANPVIQFDLAEEAVIWLDTCYNIEFDGIDVGDPNATDANFYLTGYYFCNSHNCVIKNSNVSDFDKYGIYLRYGSSNIDVDNNQLFYTTDFNNSQTSSYGIYANNLDLVENINITRNRVFDIKNISSLLYPIYLKNSSGLTANNFISVTQNNDKVYGIAISSTKTDLVSNIYHNTVYFEADFTDDSYAYYATGNAGTINLKNNILINNSNYTGIATDKQYSFYQSFVGDYNYNIENNIYYSVNGTLNNWGGTDCNDLTTWQTTYGGDANSSETLISFTNPGTCDLTIADVDLGNTALQGVYVSEVPFDIYGKSRYCQIPYIGANEADYSFVPSSNDYVIDNTGAGDFINFDGAFGYLNYMRENDISIPSGGITFEAVSGQTFYESPQELDTIVASADNPIIFTKQGTGANPIIQNDITDNEVIVLDTCQYITFDQIDIADPDPADGNNYLTAFYFMNSDYCNITNSHITDFGKYGIYLDDECSFINIDHNNLYYTSDFFTNETTVYGIYNSSMDVNQGFNITNNMIYGIKEVSSTLYGIRFMRCSGIIANNTISFTHNGNDKYYGIRIDAAVDPGQLVEIYHNTILFEGTATDDSYCYYGTGVNADIHLKNNIFINKRTEADASIEQAIIDVTFTGPTYYIDNNLYFATETEDYAFAWGSDESLTLEEWQGYYGGDYGSDTSDVQFVDAPNGDLHITGDLLGDFILAGTYTSSVTNDIDGEVRDDEYPYKGADENIENTLNLHVDCDIYSLDFEDVYVGSPEVLTFELQNNGTYTITIDSLDVSIPFMVKYDAEDWGVHLEDISIDASSSKTIEVQFDPETVEYFDTLAYIYVPNGQIIEVELLGNALAPGIVVNTQLLEFEATQINDTSAIQSFTIENTGTGALTINEIIAPTGFKIRLEGETDWLTTITTFAVVESGTQNIEVASTPLEVIEYNDILTINSNINIEVTLTGRGKGIDFTETEIGGGLYLCGTDLGDYDNDGDLDILYSGYDGTGSTTEIQIFINNGDMNFTQISTGMDGTGNGTANFVDFDNDEDLDVFISGQYDRVNDDPICISKIYLNDAGTFTESDVEIEAFEDAKSDWADFDNDGFLDLIIAGEDTLQSDVAHTYIYKNIEGTSLELISEDEITPISNGLIKAADYDNDGDMDIALTGRRGSWDYVTKIFENQDGNFVDINAGLYGVRGSKLDWGDYDNDGDLDLIVTGHIDYVEGVCKVYRNDGSNTFTDLNLDIYGIYSGDIDWIDFNQDGLLDIVMNGIAENEALWLGYFYLNQGNDEFMQMPIPDTLTSLKYAEMEFGDLDGDLDADIFVNGRYDYMDYRNFIVENTFNAENTAPQAPTNFNFTLNDNLVTFTWDAATDNESESLTYNIRVGSTSGGSDVMVSYTNAEGNRIIAKKGNVETKNTFTLNINNEGTYYASVQAIDNSYINSPFSNEVSFEVVSINDLNSIVNIYPNPTADFVKIEIDNFENTTISLFDVNGKKVITDQEVNSSITILNLSDFAAGVYTLLINSDNKITIAKIILE